MVPATQDQEEEEEEAAEQASEEASENATDREQEMAKEEEDLDTAHLFFPEHEKYKTRLIKCQASANEGKKRVQICWRGFRTAMKPRKDDLDENALNDLVMTALKHIKNISNEEQMVKILVYKEKFFFFNFCFLFQLLARYKPPQPSVAAEPNQNAISIGSGFETDSDFER